MDPLSRHIENQIQFWVWQNELDESTAYLAETPRFRIYAEN